MVLPAAVFQVSLPALVAALKLDPKDGSAFLVALKLDPKLYEPSCLMILFGDFVQITTTNLVTVILLLVIVIIDFLLRLICLVSLVRTVAHFHNSPGQEISKKQALNIPPKVWKRAAVFLLWYDLLLKFPSKINWYTNIYLLPLVEPIILFFALPFDFAAIVSVLEYHSWSALRAAAAILKGNVLRGILWMNLRILCQIPLVYWQIQRLGRMDGYLKWLEAALAVLLTIGSILLWTSVRVMFYFSCKASDESYTESEEGSTVPLITPP